MHVGHNYWHPKKFLWLKYLWSIFSFIFTILSTQWWLWTWNYAAMASCFTEIYIFLAMTVHARTACNPPKTKWNLKSHHMTPLSFVITAEAWSIVFENYCQKDCWFQPLQARDISPDSAVCSISQRMATLQSRRQLSSLGMLSRTISSLRNPFNNCCTCGRKLSTLAAYRPAWETMTEC